MTKLHTHNLKILPDYFKAIVEHRKTFEIRKNDRNFEVGDRVTLCEWFDGKYTGRRLSVSITYITNWQTGLKPDYVVFGFQGYWDEVLYVDTARW